MPDLLLETPHPDEQRSLAELRAEFRADNLARIRSRFEGYHPVGWQMIGDSSRARDHYSAEQWAIEMLRRLDAPVTQDFGLQDAPLSVEADLAELADAALLHDSVTWDDSVPGVHDHDAPPCADVHTMTDEQLCTYIDSAIEESKHE